MLLHTVTALAQQVAQAPLQHKEWVGIVIAILLVAIVVAANLKSGKRTHQD